MEYLVRNHNERYIVVASEVLSENGCYSRIKMWIEGHHDLPYSRKIISTFTGLPETEYISNQIIPTRTFTVEEALKCAA